MHGGLFSEDGVTLDDIRKIERSRQPPDSGDCVAGGSPSLPGLAGPGPAPHGQRTARPSLTFLSYMLDPCTSLLGWHWPGGRSVCSSHLFNSLQGPPWRSSGLDSTLPLQGAGFHPWSGNYNPAYCKVQLEKNLKNILLPALGVIQIERGLAGRSAGRPLVTQNPASWAPCPPWKAAPSPSP